MRNEWTAPLALLAAAAFCASCGSPSPWKDRNLLAEIQEDPVENASPLGGNPETFALLPEVNRRADSQILLPGGPEGLPSLENAHAADYESPDALYEGFVCAWPDARKAREAFEAAAKPFPQAIVEGDRFSAEDGTGRRLALLLHGRFVAGVRGAPAGEAEAFLEAVKGAIASRDE
jgi:hypothetical protein